MAGDGGNMGRSTLADPYPANDTSGVLGRLALLADDGASPGHGSAPQALEDSLRFRLGPTAKSDRNNGADG